MTLEIFKAYPPDQEGVVVELHSVVEDAIEIPIQICRGGDDLRVLIFDSEGRIAWEFGLDELVEGLRRGAAELGGTVIDHRE